MVPNGSRICNGPWLARRGNRISRRRPTLGRPSRARNQPSEIFKHRRTLWTIRPQSVQGFLCDLERRHAHQVAHRFASPFQPVMSRCVPLHQFSVPAPPRSPAMHLSHLPGMALPHPGGSLAKVGPKSCHSGCLRISSTRASSSWGIRRLDARPRGPWTTTRSPSHFGATWVARHPVPPGPR